MEKTLPKQPAVPPDIARLIPAAAKGFSLPVWVFGGAVAVTLALTLGFLAIVSAEQRTAISLFLSEPRLILWTLAACQVAMAAAAGWLLWTNVLGNKTLRAERQAFISNQLVAFDSARDPTPPGPQFRPDRARQSCDAGTLRASARRRSWSRPVAADRHRSAAGKSRRPARPLGGRASRGRDARAVGAATQPANASPSRRRSATWRAATARASASSSAT